MLRPSPSRRPVRPRRWRNEATENGASIWMMRSRSPTSSPSSSVLVATMTQLVPSANAASARRRSSTPSELWERCVSTPRPSQLGAQLLDTGAAVAEDEPLLSGMKLRDHTRRVRQASDEIDRQVGVWEPRLGRDDPSASRWPSPPASRVSSSAIADRRREADPLLLASCDMRHTLEQRRGDASRGRRRRTHGAHRQRPRGRRATGDARRPRARSGSPRATPASSAGCPAALRSDRFRNGWPTSPCQSPTERPTRPARCESRGSRLFSSALSGQR